MYRIGIDLGGTNIAAGVVDEAGRIVGRASLKTNLPTTFERIVSDITGLCRSLMRQFGDVCAVGVGVPCTGNTDTGWMEDADHLGFSAGPLVRRLEEALGLPVAIGNDANAAAWGEFRLGDYTGDSFILVTLGTGIGGGIILGGKLLSGVNHTAGELGHMVIKADGHPCSCGRAGCFETYGSATALIRQARERMRSNPNTMLWQLCGGDIHGLEAKNVFDAATMGDAAAAELLEGYTTWLSEGFANLINIFAPAVLCIGGGVSAAGDALLDPVREKTEQRIFTRDAKKKTQIVLAKLGNDAGILGAALLEK